MFNKTKFSIFAGQTLSTILAETTGSRLYRDFINDPQLNGPESTYRTGPDLSFLRNSNATFINSLCTIEVAGVNEPRFGYDSYGDYKGLLIERPSTNLIPYSNDFEDTSWFKPLTSVSVDPGVTLTSNVPGVSAPDNTETVTRMTNTSAYGYHVISWGETPVPEVTEIEQSLFYDRSIFVKKDTARYLCVTVSPVPSAESVTSIFDFDVPGFVSESTLTTYFTPYKDGWYRIGFNRLATNSNTNRLTIGIAKGPDWTDAVFEGVQTSLSSVYIWGAQAELGLYSTSYIPTSGAETSRAGDNVTIGGTNFSTFYNITAGSIKVQAEKIYNIDYSSFITYLNNLSSVYWTPEQTPVYRQLMVDNNSFYNAFSTFTNNIFTKYWSLGSVLSSNVNSFVNTAELTGVNTDIISGTAFTLAAGISTDSISFYQNGTLVGEFNSGSLPQSPLRPVQFQLGRLGNSKYIDSHIQKFEYSPTRLSNQELSVF